MKRFFRTTVFPYFLITLLPYFLISFSACKKKSVEIPADVLKKNEMIAILTDVQIAEAAITLHTTTGSNGADFTASYYKYIFNKHKITAVKYKRSMDWYAQHPELLDKVYEEVINQLSKKQSEVAN